MDGFVNGGFGKGSLFLIWVYAKNRWVFTTQIILTWPMANLLNFLGLHI